MSNRKIDPMDQYRKQEKIDQLKLIAYVFFILCGWSLVYYIGIAESIEIKSYSIYGPSKYILSLIFLILFWTTLIALAHVVGTAYLFFKVRKEIHEEFISIFVKKIIWLIAIFIALTGLTLFSVDFGCNKSNVINLFYHHTLNIKNNGLLTHILLLIWMLSFVCINMFASAYWLALAGFFVDSSVDDQ